MEVFILWRYLIVTFILCGFPYILYGQVTYTGESEIENLRWCTVNTEEQFKCGNLSRALERDRKLFGDRYFNLTCKRAFDKDECMTLLDNGLADITALDSGEVFVAGRFHSLVPIMQEYGAGGMRQSYAVAVVKKGSSVGSEGTRGLRGARACFPAVGTYAGWVLPVHTLMTEGGMEIIDCNNHVKSVINFFGPSCAPNSLVDKYNPIGDNSDKLCELCTGPLGARCSLADPYAGYLGAVRCLLETGDVAFVKHTTVPHVLAHHPEFGSLSQDKFELLCKDGSRKPINDHIFCNWGVAPANALVTSSAKDPTQIQRFQRFIQKWVELYSSPENITDFTRQKDQYGNFVTGDRDQYGNPILRRDQYGNPVSENKDQFGSPLGARDQFGNPNRRENEYGVSGWSNWKKQNTTTEAPIAETDDQVYEKFSLFESLRYGPRTDLMFEDSTRSVVSLSEDKQQLSAFLGASERPVLAIRACPVNRMTLCVTSDPELDKCVKMRTAMKAQLLKPDLICYKGHSHINCMQAIRSGQADVTMLDAADVWEGARHYELEPFLSEVYGLGKSNYYAVAVAKEQDADTELTFLRGKNTCHTGIATAAGWIYPLAYLIANGWIRPYGCDAPRAAAEWFSRSCVPGAVSPEYNAGVPHAPLCRLCNGPSYRHCRRDAIEPYYGNIGALRCLVEGGGDVAFVRHSAVAEAAGGRRREWWARNTLRDDFQLLCPDGTRAPVSDYMRCNLGLVPADAMVTRGGPGHNDTEIAAYTNLFLYAQQFYGATSSDQFSFSMFLSTPPYTDLIFSDSARQLRPIEGKDRSASHYLGRVFMRAHKLTDCTPSTSDARVIVPALTSIILALSVVVFCI